MALQLLNNIPMTSIYTGGKNDKSSAPGDVIFISLVACQSTVLHVQRKRKRLNVGPNEAFEHEVVCLNIVHFCYFPSLEVACYATSYKIIFIIIFFIINHIEGVVRAGLFRY